MKIRVVLLLAAAVVIAPVWLHATMPETWNHVERALVDSDEAGLEDALVELEDIAGGLQVRHLTPYARALAVWAATHDGPIADRALAAADRLDGQLPSTAFIRARRARAAGDLGAAAGAYVDGLTRIMLSPGTRRATLGSLVLWAILAIAATALMAMVVQVVRLLRRMAHDAHRIALTMFRRSNALVFAAVLLGLPVFAGLGPAWLLVYLFAATWIYVRASQRVAAAAVCVLLACTVPALETWQGLFLRTLPVTERIERMLDGRRLDLATLREASDLESVLAGNASYHLILGELFRMADDPERARLEYQRATLADPANPIPLVFLGNLSMEDGDVARAIQRYNGAVAVNPGYALAYHNLSSAYDMSRRFEDGDAARAKARDLAGGRSSLLGIAGRDGRLRYPQLGSKDVARLIDSIPQEARLEIGVGRPLAHPVRAMLEPSSAVFWVGGIIGLVILAVRLKWFEPARECSKCGKVYRLEETSGESKVYCEQCVSVFLKRDMVSIEQQTTKLQQIRWWDVRCSVARRAMVLIAPGSARVLAGDVWSGIAVGLVAWWLVIGVVLWLPRFLPNIVPMINPLPLQVILGLVLVGVWLWSITDGWYRR